MKKLLLGMLLVLFGAFPAVAEVKFSVNAKMSPGGYERLINSPQYESAEGNIDAVVYGWPEGSEDAEIVARFPLAGDQFSFKGKLDSPILLAMIVVNRNIRSSEIIPRKTQSIFIAEQGAITIEHALSSLNVVTGGDLNRRLIGCGDNVDCRKALSTYDSIMDDPSKDFRDRITAAKNYKMQRSKYLGSLVSSSTDERQKLLALQVEMFNGSMPRDYPVRWKEPLISQFSQGESAEGWLSAHVKSRTAARDMALNREQINEVVDFEAELVNGEKTTLFDAMEGKRYVLLEYWASWCVPCRAEFPHLKKVYAKYKDKGFELVSFTLDQTLQDWQSATEEEEIPWVNLGLGANHDAVENHYVSLVPWSYLVDCKTKRIVARNLALRGNMLDATLQQYFQ